MSRALTPAADRTDTPWQHYVRVVEFVDADPPTHSQPPVHVTRRVLFDGLLSPARIRRSDGAVVDLSNEGGTVLTLHVHRDDVTVGRLATDGVYEPWLIGDRHVLTPAEPGWEWREADPARSDDPWMVVSIYVAEIHVR